MSEPWGTVLILGPILLLAAILWAWSRNRAASGNRDEPAPLTDVNAVRGSDEARADIEADVARAEEGESPR